MEELHGEAKSTFHGLKPNKVEEARDCNETNAVNDTSPHQGSLLSILFGTALVQVIDYHSAKLQENVVSMEPGGTGKKSEGEIG